jgi:hypothetical protein
MMGRPHLSSQSGSTPHDRSHNLPHHRTRLTPGHRPATLPRGPTGARHCVHRPNTTSAPLIQSRPANPAPSITRCPRLNGLCQTAAPQSNRHSARHRLASTSRGFLVCGRCCQVVSAVCRAFFSFFCSTAPQAFFRARLLPNSSSAKSRLREKSQGRPYHPRCAPSLLP